MADSMCGPSSALQNFQKHSTIDRTLQQDRLISRQTPSQGFRSSGLNASHLDHEFESFQAGQLPLDHGFQQNIFQPAPPGMQQPGPANWAADFQRMNISSSAPQLQQQPYGMHAQQRLDTGGWHQDFARQQNQMADSSRNIQIPSHTNTPYNYSPMPVMGMMSQFSKITPQSELSISQQKQPAEAFDDEAFARAFEEAAQTEMESMQDPTQESTQNSTQNIEMGQDILLDESAEVLMASDDLQMTSDELLNQERIGADTIHDPFNQNEVKPEHQDPEELARTAAKLLDSVQHDQSVKFQNSQFLSLMRQFRDREKTVEGDNIVTKNGMGGYQNQEMNGERYQEQIEILCDALKRMIDSNSPFQRTPANVRKLIHVFFNINAIMNDLFFRAHSKPEDQSRDSYTNLHQIYNRLSPSMQGFLRKYWGAGIPCTEAWAGHILYCTEEDPDILGKFGVDPTPPPAHIQERNVQEFKMKQARPEHSNLPVFDVDAREETFLETYISELLTADTNTPEDAIKQQNALLKVLPYKIPADQRGDVWMECHLQRAREILGSYAQVQAICSWYNIWTRDLPVSDILGFMDILDKTGLASDEVVAEGNRLGRKMTRKTIARIEAKIARGEELTIQEKHFVNGGELNNDISNFQLHAGLLMQEAVAQGATKEEIEDVREKYRKFLAEAREVKNAEFEEEIQERKRTGELAIPLTQFILDTRRPESEWKAQDDLVQMRSAAVVGDKICNGSGLTELEQAVWERFQRREQEKKAAELSTTILQPVEEESRSD